MFRNRLFHTPSLFQSKKPKNHLQDKSKKACMKINQSIIQKMSDKYCKTKGNGGVNERILEPKEWVPKRLFQNNSSTLGKTKRKHPTCRVEIEYESDVCTSSESDDEMFKIRKMDFDSVCVKLIESRRRARTLQKELKDVQIRNVVLQKDLPGMINSVTGFMNSVSRTGDTKCLSNMPVHDARGCLNVSTSVVPNQECLPSASVCPTISTTPKVSKSSGNAGHSDCNFDVLESSSVAGPSNEVAKKNNSTGSHSSNDDLQAEESEGVEISDSMKSDVSKNGYTSTKYTGSSKDNDQDQGMDEPNVSVNGNTSTEYSSKDNDHEQGMDEPNDMQVPAIDAGTEERDCESLEDCYSILNKQTVLAVQKCRKWGKATGFLLRALFSKEDIRQNSRVTDKHGGQPLNPQKIGLIVRHVLKQFKGTEIEKGRTIEEKDVKDRLKHALKYWRKSLFPNVIES